MMNMKFYRNNFLSTSHETCGVGASCAIDVMLDFYYYTVYKQKGSVQCIQDSLFSKLNDACVQRDRLVQATCTSRHLVWDWLVENLSESYAPKGRGDAEILQGFRCLANQSYTGLFDMERHDQTCQNCGNVELRQSVQNPVYLPYNTTQSTHGYLPDTVRQVLLSQKCSHCKSRMLSASYRMPEYFMIELGIVSLKNSMPVLIPEEFSLEGLKFELVSAVLVKPDHFYSIIKYEEVFLVVDDLKKTCPEFDCFSGAMTGNHQLMQDHHITSNKQNGIHILIYSLSNRKEQETLLLELQTTEQLKQYTYTSNLLFAEAEDNLISSVPTSDSDKSKQKEKHQTEQIENINNGNPLPSGLVNVEGDASVPTSNSHKSQQKEKHQTEQIENINNGNPLPSGLVNVEGDASVPTSNSHKTQQKENTKRNKLKILTMETPFQVD